MRNPDEESGLLLNSEFCLLFSFQLILLTDPSGFMSRKIRNSDGVDRRIRVSPYRESFMEFFKYKPKRWG
jgi:hypothetical protein